MEIEKDTEVIKDYVVPATKVGVPFVLGTVGESYAQSQGTSIAGYMTDSLKNAVRFAAPYINDGVDAAGKFLYNYIQNNPAESILISACALGSLILANKKGYIRNPVVRE